MKNITYLLLAYCLLMLFPPQLCAQNINYFGSKNHYTLELLQHVFTYSPNKNYQLVPFTEKIPKGRAFAYMKKQQKIDVTFCCGN